MGDTSDRRAGASVLAVLVCHDGESWLPEVLSALRGLTVRPQRVLAVDTGSTDTTPDLLVAASEESLIDSVLTLRADAGFGTAVSAALGHASERWSEDEPHWLWLLHDDAAPEPDCLRVLLRSAEQVPDAGMLGPLGLDWSDPRLVVDAGLSLDTSGHEQTGRGPLELDPALCTGDSSEWHPVESDSAEHHDAPDVDATSVAADQSTWAVDRAVLAVGTAGALIRREAFEYLGGFDHALALADDDVDLGWRLNAHGYAVLSVPAARIRHAAALRRGLRAPDALTDSSRPTRIEPDADRARLRLARRLNGARTYLVNVTFAASVLGIPRLALLAVLRGLGWLLLRRTIESTVEFTLAARVISGRLGVRAARSEHGRDRMARRRARRLLTSRTTRVRNVARRAFVGIVLDGVRRDVELGRRARAHPVPEAGLPRIDVDALPEPVVRRPRAGLRRLDVPVVLKVESSTSDGQTPRPSPVRRQRRPELLFVRVNRARVFRELLLAPLVLLTVVLVGFALLTHGVLADIPRLSPALEGGRLLPADGLGETWWAYLSAWHPGHGGTGSPAPPALLVIAAFGTLLAPFGGPGAAIALLVLFGVPLAGISAYAATRGLPVSRSWRSLAAAGYALLPAATGSAAQGRLDVVVTHILLPVLIAGIASVIGMLRLTPVTTRAGSWLGTACLTALGLAVLAAFSPLMYAVLVLLGVVGFVLMPGEARRMPRRLAGLVAIVVLPVLCLLPWPLVLFEHPELFLHGIGARPHDIPAGPSLAVLAPDGSVGHWFGALIVLAALAAVLRSPTRAVVPGVLVAAVGWATAVAVSMISAVPVTGGPSSVGWAGSALVMTAAGLLWTVLAASRGRWRSGWNTTSWATAVGLIATLVVLAGGAAWAGRSGPLRPAEAPVPELDRPGGVLLLGSGQQQARLAAGPPRFGDDDLVPVPSALDWTREIDGHLRSRDSGRVKGALAALAVRGVPLVVGPARATAEIQAQASELVVVQRRLAPGTELLRIVLPSNPVSLLGPDLARQARIEPAPRPQARPLAVPAEPPTIAVRVSEGGVGRLLVIGAENEPGWRAWIDGRPASLATAWGHQVAVPLPENPSEVEVAFTETPRTTLLTVQAAAILFALIGAIPGRRTRSSE